ncbi:kinase-like domain-containing protein [Tribonema minus]|uniref:Kinase-like domain-containing protein n=1 Tax=Tribonema minus TaxID=303371 RepID=A0A835ZCF8_9STRA|nr:kinase-like domain-containing protein [Tribonema minus]
MAKVLQIEEKYKITAIAGIGNYGVVMRARELSGERLVIKVCRLAGEDTYSYTHDNEEQEWNLTLREEFLNGITRLKELSGKDWIKVPTLKHTAEVSIGAANTLGVVIMSQIDGVSMQDFLFESSASSASKRAMVCKAAMTLKALHSHNRTHGDAHLGNFLVSGDDLVVIDLDRCLDVSPDLVLPKQRLMSMRYDIAIHLFKIPTSSWKLFVTTYDNPTVVSWKHGARFGSKKIEDARSMKKLAFEKLWPLYDEFETQQLERVYKH